MIDNKLNNRRIPEAASFAMYGDIQDFVEKMYSNTKIESNRRMYVCVCVFIWFILMFFFFFLFYIIKSPLLRKEKS